MMTSLVFHTSYFSVVQSAVRSTGVLIRQNNARKACKLERGVQESIKPDESLVICSPKYHVKKDVDP